MKLADMIKEIRSCIEFNRGNPQSLYLKVTRNGNIQVVSQPMDLDFFFEILNKVMPRPDYKLIIKGSFDGEAKSFQIKLPSEEKPSEGIRRITLGMSDYRIYLTSIIWDDGDSMIFDGKTLVIKTRKQDKVFFILASLFPYMEVGDAREVAFKVECEEEKGFLKAKLYMEKDGKPSGIKIGYSKIK